MFEQEREYYEQNKADWLKRYSGKVVMVKDRTLIQVFDTMDDALAEAARRYGKAGGAMIKPITENDEVTIPALTLGVLSAYHPLAGAS